MTYIIGSARVDERGKFSGGAAGDQKQTSTPDTKGEVSRQNFYHHSKGWKIVRAKSRADAIKIGLAMGIACDNPNVGYSQSDRYSILKNGTGSKVKTNCDCSSLVRQCVKEATGTDPGDFHTGNEAEKLIATGLFDAVEYTYGMPLQTGDILITKTKGHTVIVTQGEPKKSVEDVALEVLAGRWGTGIDRQNRLHAAGYDYAEVQATVNAFIKEGRR